MRVSSLIVKKTNASSWTSVFLQQQNWIVKTEIENRLNDILLWYCSKLCKCSHKNEKSNRFRFASVKDSYYLVKLRKFKICRWLERVLLLDHLICCYPASSFLLLDALVGFPEEKSFVIWRTLFRSCDFLRRFLIVVYCTCLEWFVQILGLLCKLIHIC